MLSLTRRNVIQKSLGRWLSSSLAHKKEVLEPKQEAALEEKCYLVDQQDKVLGIASKRHCHLVQKDGTIPLHRAFSVFLFNKNGHLLLQKRSSKKITFPDVYTNSCCSHPIADFPDEAEEQDALGIRRAAQRRLNHELGIPVESIPLDKFTYITRIIYKDPGNGRWGEHELDYILFLQGDFVVRPNPDEISAIAHVPRAELDAFLPTLDAPLSPWFQLILKNRLRLWWDNLDDLTQFQDHKTITDFGSCPC